MGRPFSKITEALPGYLERVEALRETLLANLVMLGEVPAPTFREAARTALLQQRFSESGLLDATQDEVGNGIGILPGKNPDRNILLLAHADTVFDGEVDHTVTVLEDRVTGPGVGNNSTGLACLASLPTILEKLDIQLESNLILMGATRGLGRGNLEGIDFFLENNKLPIRAAVCIEGVQLGRLSISSIGMLRGEINCVVPEARDDSNFGGTGAIFTLNEVINRLVEIPLPRRPQTTIVLGSVRGGTTFNTIATQAMLQFEIRSESAEMVTEIRKKIVEIVAETSSSTGAEITFDIVSRRRPGGIPISHPLAKRVRSMMKKLNVDSVLTPSASELSAFIERKIPAATIGLTKGEHINFSDEFIEIRPLALGITQLLGILLAIDGGFCDEDTDLA